MFRHEKLALNCTFFTQSWRDQQKKSSTCTVALPIALSFPTLLCFSHLSIIYWPFCPPLVAWPQAYVIVCVCVSMFVYAEMNTVSHTNRSLLSFRNVVCTICSRRCWPVTGMLEPFFTAPVVTQYGRRCGGFRRCILFLWYNIWFCISILAYKNKCLMHIYILHDRSFRGLQPHILLL